MAVLRLDIEETIIDHPHFVDLVACIHYTNDISKSRKLAINYIIRALTVIMLELPDEQVFAINHLRGSGLVGIPWVIYALCEVHTEDITLSCFIVKSLDAFALIYRKYKSNFSLFTGSIESCFQEDWVSGRILIMPPEIQCETTLRYRMKALARLHTLTDVIASQENDYSLSSQWLVGMPQTHPHIAAILQKRQIIVDSEGIIGFNQHIQGDELLLTFLHPHVKDPTKWILVTTATSIKALKRVGRDMGHREADYWISNPDSIVTSGLYGKQGWGIEVTIQHLPMQHSITWPETIVPHRFSKDHEGLLTEVSVKENG